MSRSARKATTPNAAAASASEASGLCGGRWAWKRGSELRRAWIADRATTKLCTERRMKDGQHTRGGAPPPGASAENEQTRTTTTLPSYTCSFSDECDSAPPAYPFLNRSFLMAGGKKSRAGDAVGRRAKRAGVPEVSFPFPRKRFAQRIE